MKDFAETIPMSTIDIHKTMLAELEAVGMRVVRSHLSRSDSFGERARIPVLWAWVDGRATDVALDRLDRVVQTLQSRFGYTSAQMLDWQSTSLAEEGVSLVCIAPWAVEIDGDEPLDAEPIDITSFMMAIVPPPQPTRRPSYFNTAAAAA